MTKTSFTYDQAAAQIASYGWSGAATTPITFGFTSSDPTSPGFARFSSTLIDAGVAAMALWSDVANIKFQHVGTGNTGNAAYTNNATILFAGNFPGRTQTMPLAIYIGFETDFDVALTLSAILIGVSFVVLIIVKQLSRARSDT